MAHKKAGSSSSWGRDSRPKYLGVKVYGGQHVAAGGVIIRQRGTKFAVGKNVKRGSDDTLYSLVKGLVKFQKKLMPKFHGGLRKTSIISVAPLAQGQTEK